MSADMERAQESAGAPERWDARLVTMLGEEGVARLSRSRVLIAGVGGVGGYAAEMLARSAVGHLTLVDADNVAPSNINRQLIADTDTVGMPKTELFARRFRVINPAIDVLPLQRYITPEEVAGLLAPDYDMVIDAIDTVAPKTALLLHCLEHRIPVISSMGAGGRMDVTKVRYADISETRDDGLAREIRRRLRKAGHPRGLRVVTSSELPCRRCIIPLEERNKRSSFGTVATVPALFGIYLANYTLEQCLKSET